jgi:hypothetical protein
MAVVVILVLNTMTVKEASTMERVELLMYAYPSMALYHQYKCLFLQPKSSNWFALNKHDIPFKQ